MRNRPKSRAWVGLAAAVLSLALFRPAAGVTSGSNGTVVNNNTGYIYQPSQNGSPITVLQNGGVAAGLGLYYPHSYIVANGGNITDTTFMSDLSNNLFNGTNWTQDSLDIQMAQCFSGGFIDELDNSSVSNVAISTGAWWGHVSYGFGNAYNTFSNGWYNALISSKAGAVAGTTYSVNQLTAYTTGVTNDNASLAGPFPPPNPPAAPATSYANKELPQYYASSNAMNNDVIGVSAANPANNEVGKETALVFVGNDMDSTGPAARHWNDAVNYMSYLLAQGYTANNIYFYYANGVKPAGGAALPAGLIIDGNGTPANFNNFFALAKVKNTTGQVAVWTAGHGGLQNTFKGVAQLSLEPNNKGNLQFKFQLNSNGSDFLDEYATNPAGDADLEIDASGITGLAAGDQLDAVITDPQGDSYDLGDITSDGNSNDAWDLDIPYADLDKMDIDEDAASDSNGDLTVEFGNYDIEADPNPADSGDPAFAGDYSNVAIDDFSVNLPGDEQLLPEPAALGIGGVVAVMGLRRRPRRQPAAV
jgi:hypothetical protein